MFFLRIGVTKNTGNGTSGTLLIFAFNHNSFKFMSRFILNSRTSGCSAAEIRLVSSVYIIKFENKLHEGRSLV